MVRSGLAVVACLWLSACTDTVISNGTIGGAWGRHRTPVTYTSADVRIITERTDPRDPRRTLVCTEPSPDVAKALSTATSGHAQGSGGGPVSVTLGGGTASAEALLELAGRSTALLGLRDGLYRACEAYANGAIGDDAYALILSRYGSVMVTLFLAQDMQNTSRGTNNVQSPPVSISGNDVQITPAPPLPPKAANAASPPGGLPAMLHRVGYPDSPLSGGLAPWTGRDAPLSPPPAVPRIVPAAAGGAAGAAQDQSGDGGTTSPAAAQAIGILAKDFFASGKDSLHTLMVACINENDTTRLHGNETGGSNGFLARICPEFYDPVQLGRLAAILDPVDGKPASQPLAPPHPKPHAR